MQWYNTTYVGGCKPEPKTAWLLEIYCITGAHTAVPSWLHSLCGEYSAADKAKRLFFSPQTYLKLSKVQASHLAFCSFLERILTIYTKNSVVYSEHLTVSLCSLLICGW